VRARNAQTHRRTDAQNESGPQRIAQAPSKRLIDVRGMDAYRRLLAWQHGRALAKEIYRLTAAFPREEQFGLVTQLRRAAVSVVANIAEGQARRGKAEFAHALSIALGSLAEVSALLELAVDLGYVSEAELCRVQDLRAETSRTTFGLQRTLRR